MDDHVFGGGGRAFIVNRGDDAAGLITLHRLRAVPQSQWGSTTSDQIMIPLAQLKTSNPKTELGAALTQMDREGVNQLPVMNDGHIVGMLSREDLVTFLRTLHEIGG